MSLSSMCSRYFELTSTTLMTVSYYIKPSVELYTCGILESAQKLQALECYKLDTHTLKLVLKPGQASQWSRVSFHQLQFSRRYTYLFQSRTSEKGRI